MTFRNLMAGAALLLCAASAGPAAAGSGPAARALDSDARTDLSVTIYNRDLALVREVRTLEVPRGEFTLEYRGVPEKIEPRSLLVEPGPRLPLTILEQNYEFDLMSRDKILEKYVGKPVAWLQEDGSRVEGVLLGSAHGPVFEVGGEVVFEVPGRIALPALPQNLRARPTLVWRAESKRAAKDDIEVSYLTRGLSWSTDYVLDVDAPCREADLQAWVSLDNRSGASFADAQVLLVAGEIHQAPPEMPVLRRMEAGKVAFAMADGVRQEGLFDYHLYTMPGRTTFRDNSTKQLSLFKAAGVKVERRYRVAPTPGLLNAHGSASDKPDVTTLVAFANEKDNALGMPLPAGVVRVYGSSESGQRQLLGEDRIGHIPRDEEVELTVGKSFDIKAECTRVDYRRIGDRVFETALRVVVRNHKDDPVTVDVRESFPGEWEILSSTHSHRKLDAATARFDLEVPADGETALEFRVRVES